MQPITSPLRFFETGQDARETVSLAHAVMQGLGNNGGLYLPNSLPIISDADLAHCDSLGDVGSLVAKAWLAADLGEAVAEAIAMEALNFDIPLIPISPDIQVLELFHGPSWAFKDVGARFLSRLMAVLRGKDTKALNVLVATSGDTGGAVAMGFLGVAGITVSILYPEGRVSPLQERQIASWGQSIKAYKVAGTFDDCQRLVKTALADPAFKERLYLTTANSINFARLLPQSIYYLWAYKQAGMPKGGVRFVVPSGNLGNVYAGYLAALTMEASSGMRVSTYLAAVNQNSNLPATVSQSYAQGRGAVFVPFGEVLRSLSNAMDVGVPSNWARLAVQGPWDESKEEPTFASVKIDEARTLSTMSQVVQQFGYVMCPHTAVGWAAAEDLGPSPQPKIVLATAHAAKFDDVLPADVLGALVQPEGAAQLMQRPVLSQAISTEYEALRSHLLA